jgi:hypothetical protein
MIIYRKSGVLQNLATIYRLVLLLVLRDYILFGGIKRAGPNQVVFRGVLNGTAGISVKGAVAPTHVLHKASLNASAAPSYALTSALLSSLQRFQCG